MLSIYGECLLRFFAQIKWKHVAIPTVLSGPDRAHATIAEWLKRNRGVVTSEAQGLPTTPYPFTAVWKSAFKEFGELQNPAFYRWVFQEKKVGFTMRRPKAIIADISVNFYLKDLTQADFVQYQVHTLFPFGKTAVIPIDYGSEEWYRGPNAVFEFAKILGKQNLQLTMNNFTDSSTIEDSGLKQREIRLTLTGKLRGWIPFQPYAVPLVASSYFTLVDEDDNIISETVYDVEELK